VESHAEWIAQHLGRPDYAPLGADDVAKLAMVLREEHYPAGATIFRIGDVPARVGIVRSGAVALATDLNARRVVFDVARSGDALGDIGVFLRMTAPCEGVALEDTLILTIEAAEFHRLLEERPRLAIRWINSVSCRLVNYHARLAELLAGDMEAQIASVLVHRTVHGVAKLTQTRLGELVGGSRSSVHRVLKQLEDKSLVRVRYSHVEIRDEAGLRLIAGQVSHSPQE
jgi:CRP/FNR family transcriptional regulator